jgi:Protein of unknown function (DUF2934)
MTDETLEDRIRSRAFQIWLDEGQPAGCDRQHWERAKMELAGKSPPETETPPLQPEPIGEIKYAENQDELIDQGEGVSG